MLNTCFKHYILLHYSTSETEFPDLVTCNYDIFDFVPGPGEQFKENQYIRSVIFNLNMIRHTQESYMSYYVITAISVL